MPTIRGRSKRDPLPIEGLLLLWFPCNGRRAMADDLENSYLKPGMTRQEVVALLGEPDSYEGGYASDRTIAYEMGCFIDCDWLVVEFGATWRLIDAYVYQD